MKINLEEPMIGADIGSFNPGEAVLWNDALWIVIRYEGSNQLVDLSDGHVVIPAHSDVLMPARVKIVADD